MWNKNKNIDNRKKDASGNVILNLGTEAKEFKLFSAWAESLEWAIGASDFCFIYAPSFYMKERERKYAGERELR